MSEKKNNLIKGRIKRMINGSKTYGAVLTHRYKCPTWKKWSDKKKAPICLECFGGGLTVFLSNFLDELGINKPKTRTEYMICSYEDVNLFESKYTDSFGDVPRVIRNMQSDYKFRRLYPNSFFYHLFEREVGQWVKSGDV